MSMIIVIIIVEECEVIFDVVCEFVEIEFVLFVVECDEKYFFFWEFLICGGEFGFGGIYVSEEFGGSGFSCIDIVVIFEEFVKVDFVVVVYIFIYNMVVWMIDSYGD